MGVEEIMKNKCLDRNMTKLLVKERPVYDGMHLISPALHKCLNLVLLSVPQLQSLEKPQLALCFSLEQPITRCRIKRILLFYLDVYDEWEFVFQAKQTRFETAAILHPTFVFKCSVKHIIFMDVNCSAGLYVCREVCTWLGAPESSITSVCPFSFTLSFLYEQKKAKRGPKSLVIPRQVKALLPGARSGHHKISAASSSACDHHCL